MKTTPKQPSTKQTKPVEPASNRHIIINYLLIGIAVGLLLFALFRFIAFKPAHDTHYHANWSVYINGQQQTFADPLFYQEVATCSVNDETNPLHRAHMHDNVFNIIHVHADGVTYNQFLENINSSAQPEYLRIGSGVYQNNGDLKVTYVLNGKQINSLNGVVIGDQDKLLINYGNDSAEVVTQRYAAIQNNAKHYDETKDPASCSGSHTTTLQDRLHNILF